jgi:hypothetical protein
MALSSIQVAFSKIQFFQSWKQPIWNIYFSRQLGSPTDVTLKTTQTPLSLAWTTKELWKLIVESPTIMIFLLNVESTQEYDLLALSILLLHELQCTTLNLHAFWTSKIGKKIFSLICVYFLFIFSVNTNWVAMVCFIWIH